MQLKEKLGKIGHKIAEVLIIASVSVGTFAATNGIIAFAETVAKTATESGVSTTDGADYIYLGDGTAWRIQSRGNIVYENGNVKFCSEDIRKLAAESNAIFERLGL